MLRGRRGAIRCFNGADRVPIYCPLRFGWRNHVQAKELDGVSRPRQDGTSGISGQDSRDFARQNL